MDGFRLLLGWDVFLILLFLSSFVELFLCVCVCLHRVHVVKPLEVFV